MPIDKLCAYCSGTFTARKSSSKYCSQTCQGQYNGRRHRRIRNCKHCGNEFPSRHHERNNKNRRDYCGAACFPSNRRKADSENLRRVRARRARVRAKLDRAAAGRQGRRGLLFVAGNCRTCDQYFIHITSRRRDEHLQRGFVNLLICCSDDCRLDSLRQYKKAAKAYRKALLRSNTAEGYLVRPRSVYIRDGWICGICNNPVDRNLYHPHPMSVSLDHIIPVSKGGGHTYDNLQCSHLICNIRKSNKTEGITWVNVGQQLALPICAH